MKVLVSGGCGFIGSHFVRKLYNSFKKVEVFILDNLTYAGNLNNISDLISTKNKIIKFFHGDVCNPEIVDKLVKNSDYVIHFAAETHVARSIHSNKVFFQTDVLGTQTICNAILNSKVKKFIHISSSEVYGTLAKGKYKAIFNMSENHPLNPMSPYAAAKAGADRLVYSYYKTYGIPAIIVRPFNNYGPNQHTEKMIPKFITNIIRNKSMLIHGNGEASRDWVYVEDTCAALYKILLSKRKDIFGETFNIGTEVTTSIKDIVNKIEYILYDTRYRYRCNKRFVSNRPGQVSCHLANGQKFSNFFNWRPKIKLDEGLQSTLKWYIDNKDWWKDQIVLNKVPIKIKGKIVWQ